MPLTAEANRAIGATGESQQPSPPTGGTEAGTRWNVLADPIDPRNLLGVPFGSSSFWIQPWRAYLETWPSGRLGAGLGINFNVQPAQAQATAQALQEAGFTLARREIPWDALSYSEPSLFKNEAGLRSSLEALHDHHLRPLLVLNANSGDPVPSKGLTLTIEQAAPAGSSSVQLSPSSAAAVVPGRTGFNALSFGGAADMLITSVGPSGQATLARPLPKALAAGAHAGATLLYPPFARPTLEDGLPNPAFAETLRGWLAYLSSVCRLASGIFGAGGFDIEIWNELAFGSQFLNAENYYGASSTSGEGGGESAPAGSTAGAAGGASEALAGGAGSPADGAASVGEEAGGAVNEALLGAAAMSKREVTHAVIRALLAETVAFIRNPANGISPEVGISDGFASQSPFPSGADAPIGLNALSKHLYAGARRYPAAYRVEHIVPLNALGQRDTISKSSFLPRFIPEFQSLFPEFFLTATITETIVRDLAPFTTYIYGFPHGREVGPPGGQPLQKWMTEYNLGTEHAAIMAPDGTTPLTSATLTEGDRQHFEAKTLLRSLVAMIGAGMSREYFFAAAPGSLGVIPRSFFEALEAAPGHYPGLAAAGETLRALHNLIAATGEHGSVQNPQRLTLLSIAQLGDHAQFAGDGSPEHHSLFDRETFALFPFQASAHRFVIPYYVMTRDMLTLYEPAAPTSDPARFDLPGERFRVALSGLPVSAVPPSARSYDPITEGYAPATLIARAGSSATFEVQATDYPRLLELEYH